MLSPLTSEQLATPTAESRWTNGQIAQHIVGNRVWWFHIWMGQGDPALADIAHWDPADEVKVPPKSAAELVAALEATWQMIADALNQWTADDLALRLPFPSALREDEQPFFPDTSRQWIIWHTLEHEIHHGGELSLALGMLGLHGVYGPA